MNETKSLFASKTFWFNVLSGAAQVLGYADGLIPPQYAPFVALGHAVLNIALRAVTSTPVTLTGK